MKRYAIIAAGVISMCVGCGGPSGPVASGPKVNGQRIAVVEFATNEAVVHYEEPVDTFGLSMAEQVAAFLRERGYQAEAFPAAQPVEGEVVVKGHYTLIDGGSRALRYWVGFGAGAAKVKVAGDVARSDGAPLGSFSDGRGSGFGIFGGSSKGLLEKCVRHIASDIARMIDSGEYRQVAG